MANPAGGFADFTLSPQSLTFTTADYSTPQTVSVLAVNDLVAEARSEFHEVFITAESSDAAFNSTPPSFAFDSTPGNTHALSFTGAVTDYASLGFTDADLTEPRTIDTFPTTQLTVEFWMKHSISDTNHRGIISYAAPSSFNEFLIKKPSNLVVQIGEHGDAAWATLVTGNADGQLLNNGQWHHIAITWVSSTGDAVAYVDGVHMQSISNFLLGHSIRSDGFLVVGHDQDAIGGGFQATDGFIGYLDEIRIWNVARSGADIQGAMRTLIDATAFASSSALFAYYRLDEGDGSTLINLVANRPNLTITAESSITWVPGLFGLFMVEVQDDDIAQV
jgi:hypothetical protein